MSRYSVPDSLRSTAWQDAAACRTEDPELFYASERDPRGVEAAREICGRCPSRTGCLTAAYQEGDTWAIRGGLTNRQRGALLRKHGGNITRAVADALEDTALLLREIYTHHAQPSDGGHVMWTDHRHAITVRGKPYTVHQIAWQALHGRPPVGHVQRSCAVEGCVAQGCLTDRPMRERSGAAA